MVRMPCASQSLVSLVDVLDRVREASAGSGSPVASIPSRRREHLSVTGWRIRREQQYGGVESQDSPPEQPSDDRCFDHDAFRKTARANSSRRRTYSVDCRCSCSYVRGLRGGVELTPGRSPGGHESLDVSRRSRSDEMPALAAVNTATPAAAYAARRTLLALAGSSVNPGSSESMNFRSRWDLLSRNLISST